MKELTIKRLYQSKVFMAFFFTVILIIGGEILADGFASFNNMSNIFVIASFLGMIALAQTVVMISDGGIDLSVGAIMQISTILVADFSATMAGGFWVGLLVSLLLCTLFGWFNGLGIAYLNIPPLVMTLAMSSVVIGLLLIYSGGFPQGMAPMELQNFVYGDIADIPNMLILWALITAIVIFVARKTKLGRMVYGVGANRMTAELSGVNTRRVRALSYAVSGFVCGFTGVLMLGYMSVPNNLDSGATYIMPSIAASVVGGIALTGGSGNYLGAVAGALLLTTLESLLMTMSMGEPIRKIVYGAVIVGILILYGRKKN